MLAGKTLLDYTNLFSLNDYEKNDKILYKYFKGKFVKSQVHDKKKIKIKNRWNKKLSFR